MSLRGLSIALFRSDQGEMLSLKNFTAEGNTECLTLETVPVLEFGDGHVGNYSRQHASSTLGRYSAAVVLETFYIGGGCWTLHASRPSYKRELSCMYLETEESTFLKQKPVGFLVPSRRISRLHQQ